MNSKQGLSWAEQYIPKGHQPNTAKIQDVYVDATRELLKPYPSTKLNSFPLFNQTTGGLRAHEFSILCGGTGTGKTTLVANWVSDLIVQQVSTFVASIETGKEDMVKRTISTLASSDWNQGDAVLQEDLERFNAKHLNTYKQSIVHLSKYNGRADHKKLLADVAYHYLKDKTKIAIVDNFNFFLGAKAHDLTHMDNVTHDFIMFCKRIPIHIIMIMHPKKTDGRVETEHDIKGSSTAVQEAQNVLLFNRVRQELVDAKIALSPFDRELKIAKMRRKGKYVGRTMILGAYEGVDYYEREKLA